MTMQGKKHSAETRAKMSAAAKSRAWPNHLVHGMSKSPTWYSWSGMFGRCENPKNPAYARYGGRGIAICDRTERRSTESTTTAITSPAIADGPLRRSRPTTGAIRARK